MTVLPLSPTNGTQRGRTVAPHHRYTFASSGVTIECHKISPTFITAISAAILKECKARDADAPNAYPRRPTRPTLVGGEMREEEVHGGEEYDAWLAAMQTWQAWAEREMGLRVLQMVALDYLIINDSDIAEELERVRRSLARQGAEMPELGFPLDGYTPEEQNRLYFLFTRCMLDPENDGQAFFQFLVGRAQPREEAVAATIASFRSPE